MSFAEVLSSLELGLIYSVVCMGLYLTFRVIDFADLTVDGSFVAGAAASSMAIQQGGSAYTALLLALLAGGAAGLLTGLMATWGRISALLSGILSAYMFYSVNLRLMGGTPNITLSDESTIFAGHNPLFILVIIVTALWAILSWLMSTDFGLSLRSIGSNKLLATIQGLNIPFLTIFTLILSNALVGLAGGLFSQHQGFTDISQGLGTVIVGLAGVMMGEYLLSTQSLWKGLFACILGPILYRFVVALSLHVDFLGFTTSDLNFITGIFILMITLTGRKRKSVGGIL